MLAGLGVLNSVLMLTRERVHDLGIFKALGMTPPQSMAMVTCWIIVPAIAAAIIALPAGMALQNAVMHAIAGGLPGSVTATSIGSLVHVYTPGGLTLLALAGLAIAITGALGPAAWAAASRTPPPSAPNRPFPHDSNGQANNQTAIRSAVLLRGPAALSSTRLRVQIESCVSGDRL